VWRVRVSERMCTKKGGRLVCLIWNLPIGGDFVERCMERRGGTVRDGTLSFEKKGLGPHSQHNKKPRVQPG